MSLSVGRAPGRLLWARGHCGCFPQSASPLALDPALCSRLALCRRVAAALEAGMVWINCSQPCFCQAPWGGIKNRCAGRVGWSRVHGRHLHLWCCSLPSLAPPPSPLPLLHASTAALGGSWALLGWRASSVSSRCDVVGGTWVAHPVGSKRVPGRITSCCLLSCSAQSEFPDISMTRARGPAGSLAPTPPHPHPPSQVTTYSSGEKWGWFPERSPSPRL